MQLLGSRYGEIKLGINLQIAADRFEPGDDADDAVALVMVEQFDARWPTEPAPFD